MIRPGRRADKKMPGQVALPRLLKLNGYTNAMR